ncbi:hypothetical protein KEH51_19805 [[Brevibacterium] frigoritolerans]|uniref:Uncharacterized protein n=1 Tax=Peribacillus frigoritolerans TaxID=450367 RepID=A0A941FSW2_9BACI|nr:hypothetical protein [Peribacillus frigoritolerans]
MPRRYNSCNICCHCRRAHQEFDTFRDPGGFQCLGIFDQWQEALKEGTADFDETIDIYQTIPASAVKYGIRLITSPVYISPYLSLLNQADDENTFKTGAASMLGLMGMYRYPEQPGKQITKDLLIKIAWLMVVLR